MLVYPLGGAPDEALTHKISVVQLAIQYIICMHIYSSRDLTSCLELEKADIVQDTIFFHI
jgi:hypothetical protein